MKKIILSLVLCLAAGSAFGEDSLAKKVWTDLNENSSWHVLDNATPSMFLDCKSHEWLAGATTELYRYRFMTLDGGAIKSVEPQGSSHGIPVGGLNLHIGELLASSEKLMSVVNMLIPDKAKEGILGNLKVGGYVARDLDLSIWRYGVYGGIGIKF